MKIDMEGKKMATTTYDKWDVLNIFSNSTDEEIMQNYTLNELTEMYISVYGKKSGLTKRKIVSAFREMYFTSFLG